MMDKLSFVLTFVSTLGAGLIAGFFLAFSIVVMKALGQQPPAQGIAAMQSINIVVINPMFFTAFFGTAVACLGLVVSTFLRWQRPGAAYLLAGSLLYLLGAILVTILFNVPRNNALAAVDPTSTEGANVWANYLSSWTAWNHVRTIAALAAAASFAMALYQRR
jgi:uncharacterized membrane protein